MKKTICVALAIMALVLGNALSGYADRGGGGGQGGGGGHGGGGHSVSVGHGGGGWHGGGGGWHRGGGGWHRGGWRGGWYGGFGWGPWWWGYPYYPYYPYYAPTVVAPQEPEVYVQPEPQQEEPSYWYFCRDPEGYYPYVKKCPKGWLRVVPQAPGDEEE